MDITMVGLLGGLVAVMVLRLAKRGRRIKIEAGTVGPSKAVMYPYSQILLAKKAKENKLQALGDASDLLS